MKKIFTLAASALLGATGLMAMPSMPAELANMKYELTREAQQQIRTTAALNKVASMTDSENVLTRSWKDHQGNTWNLFLVKWEQPLCELLSFRNQAGEIFQCTFEELPLYAVQYNLAYTPKNASNPTREANELLFWPNMNYYANATNADGTPDYSLVPLSELANNTRGINIFEQSQNVMSFDSNDYVVAWGMMGLGSSYEGASVDSADGSTLEFLSYDPNANEIHAKLDGTFKEEGGSTRPYYIACDYNGQADRVLGFESVYKSWKFGEIHLYNAGVINSEMFDDDNPFMEEFGDVTAFYILAGADGVVFPGRVADASGAFDPSKVGPYWEQGTPTSEMNFMMGYLFADKSYGEDLEKDPVDLKFTFKPGTPKQSQLTQTWYETNSPAPDTFVRYAYSGEEWQSIYGLEIVDGDYYYTPAHESYVEWGTTEGFYCDMLDEYSQYLTITDANQEFVYWYDPEDISKSRNVTLMGNKEVQAVEGVQADVNAKVVARDGKIVVNAAEKAPIAVYTLEGKLVKAAEAQNVTVEAAKGVYVVRVGNKAKKVVL